MAAEPYCCDLDPDTETTLRVHLFRKVRNVEEIRCQVMAGAWKCAVVKASLVVHPLQLAAAANRAVLAQRRGAMITRTVFAEILYNLSLSKNISQSLSKFGAGEEGDVLVCFLAAQDEAAVLPLLQGEARPLSQLPECTRAAAVRKHYGSTLLDTILTRMVTKNFVSH